MSFVNATPEYVAAAASDLAKIGAAINYANSVASGATSAVQAAGADAVSASISHLFGVHAAAYQAISAQAALFHQQFVELMSGGANQYADTEAVNAAPLAPAPQAVLGAANVSGQAMSSQQFIGAAAQAGGVASGVPVAAGVQPGAVAAAPAGSVAQGDPAAAAATTAAAPDASSVVTASAAPVDAATAELSSATMLPAAMPTPSNEPAPPPPSATGKGWPPTPSR